MDGSAEWAANALFSPSKARAQQALAKDWAAVDAWLSKKYGSQRLPNFERNEETLQALLTLANASESADEQRGYVERVEKSALQAMSKRHSQLEDSILKPLLASFDHDVHLNVMAEAAVKLDCPTASAANIGASLVDLSTTAFELEQAAERLKLQLAALQAEQERVTRLVAELESDAFQPPQDTLERTTEWTKSTKQLKAKIAEYDERLSATKSASLSSTAFDQYLSLVRDNADQKDQLATLNAQLQAYQDLPAETKAARAKVEAARDQLRKLTAKRERLFEGLADG